MARLVRGNALAAPPEYLVDPDIGGKDPRLDRPHPTDEELLARLPVERDAFSEFYRRHAQRVLGFAARRLGDPEEVADAVAMIFVAVAESAAGFQPDRGRAVSWLYGLAANVVAEQRRRGAREARALARLSGRALVEPDDYADLERAIDAAAQARGLYEAMDTLPGGERAVLELVALEQFTIREVAVTLGIRPGTARVRLARARRRLRERLGQPRSSALVRLGSSLGPAPSKPTTDSEEIPL
jgi:RNA polymerase sigma-70 factor (ECF subfamily)